VASSKRDRARSNRVGVAHHGQRPIFRSMLGLGRTAGNRNGKRCRSPLMALRSPLDAIRSGKADLTDETGLAGDDEQLYRALTTFSCYFGKLR
jgi:hypothetical protein